MKFPNYGPGAQGDLLIANTLAADDLRPYAEMRHYDQVVSKQGPHLYVDREAVEPVDATEDPVGGVVRMIGHQTGGYATFKGNGEDAYHLTTALYALDGQTSPAQTWPTFWRRGLSGPAAVWAQWARGFAQSYAAYLAREQLTWASPPDIGDAVVIVPHSNAAPRVYCLLGTGPVQWLRVEVTPLGAFPGADVPDAILDLFGGVPVPPLQSQWATAPELLSLAAIKAACGVTSEALAQPSPQDAAFGPYAVAPDGRRADTVRLWRTPSTGRFEAAQIRLGFTADTAGLLTATADLVSKGFGLFNVYAYGQAWTLGQPFAVTYPGPGWAAPGEATCPIAVTYVGATLTVVESVRRTALVDGGNTLLASLTRVGALEVYDYRRQAITDASYHQSSYVWTNTLSGGPGAWSARSYQRWTLDEATGPAVQEVIGEVGVLHFSGAEGCWSVTTARGTTAGRGGYQRTGGEYVADETVLWDTDAPPVLEPNVGPINVSRSPRGSASPTAWTGQNAPYGVGGFVETEVPQVPAGPIVYQPARIYAGSRVITVDLAVLYTSAGALPPTAPEVTPWVPAILTELPRADVGQPAYIETTASVIGGEQVVARVAGLADVARALPGMTAGTLVSTAEDDAMPHAYRVYFVGELQP